MSPAPATSTASGRPGWLRAVLVLAEFPFAVIACWLLCLPMIHGYHLAACSGGIGASGMTLLVAVFAPLVYPLAGVALLAAAVAACAWLQPFRCRRMWIRLHWIVLGALLAGVASWGIATIADLHARCSIGF